ncbi:hypothetical protein KGM_210554 [Danaus plexippus plexippus]|uniref:Uncharacterized protein n=1 Tax=Danaus plexippus plexippus TaxID=278856 RepID=A0A212EHG7_DANPL|nr:hypothetical protein KGM_210554 [Danaus plexippus plexippus]
MRRLYIIRLRSIGLRRRSKIWTLVYNKIETREWKQVSKYEEPCDRGWLEEEATTSGERPRGAQYDGGGRRRR